MSSDSSSHESLQSTTVKRLMEENKIKDLALQKATSLIELLTIELEAQKQSTEQQLRKLSQEYEGVIKKLLQKMSSLEESLSKSATSSVPSTSQTYLALNKKTFHTRRAMTADLSIVKLDHVLLYEEISKIQGIQREVFQELTAISAEEQADLHKIITSLQNYKQNLDEVFEALPQSLLPREIEELREVIQSQQAIINQMRHYIQELQDSYQSVLCRLESTRYNLVQDQLPRGLEGIISQIKTKIVWAWRQQRLQWSFQNGELRSILQKLIELVQSQRVSQPQLLSL